MYTHAYKNEALTQRDLKSHAVSWTVEQVPHLSQILQQLQLKRLLLVFLEKDSKFLGSQKSLAATTVYNVPLNIRPAQCFLGGCRRQQSSGDSRLLRGTWTSGEINTKACIISVGPGMRD